MPERLEADPRMEPGNPPSKQLAAAVDRLNRAVGSIIRWMVLAMVLAGTYNTLARYATRWFDVGLTSNALIDLQWYLFSLIFLLGAAYALEQDVHVRVDVLYSRLGSRGRAWIDLLGTILFLLPFSLVVLWVSYPAVRNSWAIRETSPDPGGLARYPIKAVILVSFVLLVLQGIAQIPKHLAVIRGTEEVAEEEVDEEGRSGLDARSDRTGGAP